MIKWIMVKYNKVVADIKAELPKKDKWIVKILLRDTREIEVEYEAYSMQQVKGMYDMDIRVYNGLIANSGVSKKYIKKKDIDRVLDIFLISVDCGEAIEDDVNYIEGLME